MKRLGEYQNSKGACKAPLPDSSLIACKWKPPSYATLTPTSHSRLVAARCLSPHTTICSRLSTTVQQKSTGFAWCPASYLPAFMHAIVTYFPFSHHAPRSPVMDQGTPRIPGLKINGFLPVAETGDFGRQQVQPKYPRTLKSYIVRSTRRHSCPRSFHSH